MKLGALLRKSRGSRSLRGGHASRPSCAGIKWQSLGIDDEVGFGYKRPKYKKTVPRTISWEGHV